MAKETSFERTVLLRAALMAAPGVVLAIVVLYYVGWPMYVKLLALLSTLCATVFFIRRFVQQLFYPINTATNLLEALREGDYTLRATTRPGALGTLVAKVNMLAETLKSERLRAQEASALLNKVLDEVDVSVLAFDEDEVLRLANKSALALFRIRAKDIGEITAHDMALAELDRKSTRLNSSHSTLSRMPSSA